MQELRQAIYSLKNGKTPGPDNIMAEFLKHLGKQALALTLHIFNQIWNSNIPSEWKKATVIPILKTGKPVNLLSSYRPISLTSVIGKTMERMINNRLSFFLENNNSICTDQAGFRKHHSTNQQILRLSQDVKDAMDKRCTTLAVFVDFKGAYDAVWRAKLMEKLQHMGINGKMLRWIYLFINQRYCSTRVNTSTSKYKQQKRGLPQGSVISPLLFNVMINDLAPSLAETEGIKTALFADDLAIWISLPKNKEKQLSDKMNEALNILSNWSKKNCLPINLGKTFYHVFTLAHKTPDIKLQLDGKNLNPSTEPKYLGMYLDQKMSWQKHVENTARKARMRLNVIKRLAGKQWGSSLSVLNTTYKTYIKPAILYGCETLITAKTDALELVQNQALRLITGAVKSTLIPALQIATNNIAIKKEIEILASIQYEKLIRLPSLPYWSDYKRQPRQLKTQKGFVQCIDNIKPQYFPITTAETLLTPTSPLLQPDVHLRLNLTEMVTKSENDRIVLKQLTLETIHQFYPSDNWLHIYTDGSQIGKNGKVGVGVYSSLFSFYHTLGDYHTNFDGEMEAIRLALEQLLLRPNSFEKTVLLSDSQAALQAIASAQPRDSRVAATRSLLMELQQNHKQICFQWIPSHCGIAGNEAADTLAKKGTKIVNTFNHNISFNSDKLHITVGTFTCGVIGH